MARTVAMEHLALLRELPLALAPIILREVITYDWKMPAERDELNKQFHYFNSLTPTQRGEALSGFRGISLSSELQRADWVNEPAGFMEMLTAWLWSTHQMDHFRALADTYAGAVNSLAPQQPPSQARLGIVIIGAGAEKATSPLFRKLRPSGVHLTAVQPADGVAILLAEAARRAGIGQAEDSRFQHWYIDGGRGAATPKLTQISYAELEHPRALLLARIQHAIASGSMGPEQLRSLLARIRPADLGLGAGPATTSGDQILNHFQLTLLTEGAGTQIFATTFVQWAARECIRRAHPETLIVRYAPRQQAQTMNMMLTGATPTGLDPSGSLVDADLGAYYTWINMRRLSGAEELRFLVWFEGSREAVAIGPGLPRGTTSASIMDMHKVLALLG